MGLVFLKSSKFQFCEYFFHNWVKVKKKLPFYLIFSNSISYKFYPANEYLRYLYLTRYWWTNLYTKFWGQSRKMSVKIFCRAKILSDRIFCRLKCSPSHCSIWYLFWWQFFSWCLRDSPEMIFVAVFLAVIGRYPILTYISGWSVLQNQLRNVPFPC